MVLCVACLHSVLCVTLQAFKLHCPVGSAPCDLTQFSMNRSRQVDCTRLTAARKALLALHPAAQPEQHFGCLHTHRPAACCVGHACVCACRPVPGFVSKVIYGDAVGTWSWLPYKSRNNVLLAEGKGVDGSTATCSTISEGGGVEFQCKQCAKPGYQPFAKAEVLRFDIRSDTNSNDEFASSTPRGELPPLKMFLMNVSVPAVLLPPL